MLVLQQELAIEFNASMSIFAYGVYFKFGVKGQGQIKQNM